MGNKSRAYLQNELNILHSRSRWLTTELTGIQKNIKLTKQEIYNLSQKDLYTPARNNITENKNETQIQNI